jgi:hypothetical protein
VTVGGDVLSYKFRVAEGNSHASVWLLTFYGQIRFFGMVVGKTGI